MFLFLGNVPQGLLRDILAHKTLVLSATPTFSHPLPPSTYSISLLDAAAPFVELPGIISPYSSGGPIAIEHIGRRSRVFSLPIPRYQPSLISVTPSHLPNLLPHL